MNDWIKWLLGFGLILDALAFAALGELREKKWYFRVWLPLIILSGIGSFVLLMAIVGALNVTENDAAGGFMGLGLVLLGGASLPYPVLLALCLWRRPLKEESVTSERGR